jgi:hypothetical protein
MPGDETDRQANTEARSEPHFASPERPSESAGGPVPMESFPRKSPVDDSISAGSLLGQVLEETIGEDSGPMLPEEMETLQAVASRLHRKPFGLDPVGIALVESLLALRLPEFQPNEAKWHNMARQIATAFFESPSAHARLERFWKRQCALIS